MTTQAAIEPAEMATILAALRFYQEKGQGDPDNRSDDIHEIATRGDAVVSLDAAAIDDLCERLNTLSATQPDLEARLLALIDGGLNFGRAVPVFAEHQRRTEPGLSAYADAPGPLGMCREGELEVDGDAIVSESADGGAYVMAWLWVSDEDAGVERDEEEDETTAQEEDE